MSLLQIIKYEYFELIRKLNQTNKLKNQQTDICFYIDSANPDHLKLFAAVSENQKILLCEKIKLLPWTQASITELTELEEFLSYLLNTEIIENGLTFLIKSHIFKSE